MLRASQIASGLALTFFGTGLSGLFGDKLTGETVRVLTYGQLATSGLTVGSDYYLSDSSAGGITTTPPSGSGKYLVRVGRASSTTQLIVKIEAPVDRS